MTTLLIITAYVLNVFLNRFLNKIAYQRTDFVIAPITWFFPIIPALFLIFVILEDYLDKYRDNWFNGSRW